LTIAGVRAGGLNQNQAGGARGRGISAKRFAAPAKESGDLSSRAARA